MFSSSPGPTVPVFPYYPPQTTTRDVAATERLNEPSRETRREPSSWHSY